MTTALALSLILFSPFQAAAPSDPARAPRSGVEVTHLANEGFLLRSAESTVLIDGFLEEPYSLYEALPEARFEQLMEARDVFDGEVLCLASHVHRDHFQPGPAAAYLRTNPEARLVSSFDVVAALREENPTVGGSDRVRALFPKGSMETVRLSEDLQVRFLDLPHGGRRWSKLQNLGHEITLAGLTFLHVGDADTQLSLWRRHGMQDRHYDVALIPSWFFESAEGTQLLREVIQADHLVACHLPAKDRRAFRERTRAQWPGLWVPGPEAPPRLFTPSEPTSRPEGEVNRPK